MESRHGERQEAFKKNLPEIAARESLGQSRPVRLMFEDEARFGRINDPRHCWAPEGCRPDVSVQIVREFIVAALVTLESDKLRMLGLTGSPGLFVSH